jgi:uncharacterized membrane protein
MWMTFALLAAALWGVGQIFTKKGLSETSPLFNNLLGAVVTIVLIVPFVMLNGANLSDVPKIFPLACIITFLLLSYYYIIGVGKVSLTGTVLAMYPLITIFLSLIFLRENPNLYQKLAVLIVLSGTFILAIGEDIAVTKKLRFGRWFWIAIIGACLSGSSDFLAKVALNKVGNTYSYLLAYAIAFMAMALISIFIDKKGRKMPKINKKIIPTLLGVTMMESGMIAYYIALSLGFVSLVTPISSAYVAITAILAWIFLKEKVNKIQAAGIIFSVFGIILLGVS